jgi:elongation factor Ts
MAISIEQLKALRDRTGVSMTACKTALEEANGDENLAIELLRKKGEAKAAERGDRVTSNGVVAIVQDGSKAAMLALACETDFVAKNADFIKKAEDLARQVLASGEELDLNAALADLNIQMGEKIAVKDRKVVEASRIGSYVHLNNRIGVMVSMEGGDEEMGRDIAMHIAAMNPRQLSPDEISADLVSKEREIWTEQLKQEGKPEAIVEKILIGKEKKFREESALLTQMFVKNPEQTIQSLLNGARILSFVRFEV